MVQSEVRGRTEKEVQDDIERLKDWLQKQPHLPHDIENSILRWFVVGTKTLEVAKRKLDIWISFKSRVPELFSSEARNPLDPQYKLRNLAIKIFFSPNLTQEGYLVMWIATGRDLSAFNHTQEIARCTMMLELALQLFPDMKGIVLVYDLGDLPAYIYTRLSGPNIAFGLQWFQNCMPVKLKSVSIINAPTIIYGILNTLFKPFLKEKLYKRISVSTEGEEILKKLLPDDLIPSDYGGNAKCSEELNAEWEKNMESWSDWFKKTSQLQSDEKKRPADKLASYGVEGTFRSLSID